MTHKGEAYVLVYGSDEVVFEMMKKEQNLRAYGDYKEIIPRSSPSPTTARDLLRYTGEMILDVGDNPTTAQTLTMFIFGRFNFYGRTNSRDC